MRMYAGLLIFCFTLLVILIRPLRITEAKAAAAGAILMIVFQFVGLRETWFLLCGKWNVFGFFLGLMLIAAAADSAGAFDLFAYEAGRWARSNSMRLYVILLAIGVFVTAFLSNDATALILTPAVYAVVTRLRLPVLPFLFACTFIADTASFILPVSNPINIVVIDSFHGNTLEFFRFLFLPAICCVLVNIALFCWLFRKDLRLPYNVKVLQPPRDRNARFLRFTLIVLAITAFAYIVASIAFVPVSLIALGAAFVLIIGTWKYLGSQSLIGVFREVSWSVFVFVAGMFVLVQGIEHLGITKLLGAHLPNTTGIRPILVTAGATAFGSNLINNIPMSLVAVSALRATGAQHSLYYAAILGCDLGPNLTTVGSLATMLWILILRRKGLEISTLQYLKLGLTVVPLMILIGSILIWLLI